MKTFRELVITKKDKFSLEHEYRIIQKSTIVNPAQGIKPNKVIIGYNVKESDQKLIISICKDKKIPFIFKTTK